jgi:hypothetical protein
MMVRARLSALLVAIGAVASAVSGEAVCAQEAHADEPPLTRLSAGFGGGATLAFDVSVDGAAGSEPIGDATTIVAALGVDRSLLRWLAVGVEARVGTWASAWSQAAGYETPDGSGRNLFDLDGMIKLRSPVVTFLPRPVVFSLSPSVGFTWPEPPSRDTRAVTERWQARGGGGNAGVELTCETWFKLRRSRWQLGAAAGVGYVRRWFSLDAQFTPVADPGATVSTHYDYVVDQILFNLAFLAGF